MSVERLQERGATFGISFHHSLGRILASIQYVWKWGAEGSNTVKETAADKARDQIYPVSMLISSRWSNSDNTVAAVAIQGNWHETDAPNGTEAQANGRSKGQVLPPH